MEVLAYERIDPEKLSEAIRVGDGEFVICRNAFRWKKDGVVIGNGYEMFEMETIAADNNWEIVERYGSHIAVCKALNPLRPGTANKDCVDNG